MIVINMSKYYRHQIVEYKTLMAHSMPINPPTPYLSTQTWTFCNKCKQNEMFQERSKERSSERSKFIQNRKLNDWRYAKKRS